LSKKDCRKVTIDFLAGSLLKDPILSGLFLFLL